MQTQPHHLPPVPSREGIRFFDLEQGVHHDARQGSFPSSVQSWQQGPLALPAGATHLGYVYAGQASLECASGRFELRAGMYFASPGESVLRGGAGVVISRWAFQGMFLLGGPIEAQGRLRYIDGCTDSLLLPPVTLGDPCLNLLHIPPHTAQTSHTHPSLRAGVIVRGEGHCITPAGSTALRPGQVFVIDAEQEHCFHTTDSELVVIAYHPDSDCGPTHEDHPMLNRTILGGGKGAPR